MIKQVLSAEQMQELIDMGIDTSNASLYWAINKSNPSGRKKELMKPFLTFYTRNQVVGLERFEYIPAFTLQDMLEILPKPCYLNCIDNDFYQCEITTENGSSTTNGTSPLNAAFNMLKWCKTNNQL